MISLATVPGVGPFDRREIQALNHAGHIAGKVVLGQPLLHRGRKEKVDVSVDRVESGHVQVLSEGLPVFYPFEKG